MPDVTSNGGLLFGKNSDRDRNEPMALEFVPGAEHAKGSTVRITRICVPQASRTFDCYIARPAWMWGAEIACNEYGVVCGNEALFAREPPRLSDVDTLTGMDICRLAIERSTSAAQARDIVTHFVENYHQGGNCGYKDPFYYHNAFLIADCREAFHIETKANSWVCKRVTGGVYAISNAMRIRNDFDSCSADIRVRRLVHSVLHEAAVTACGDSGCVATSGTPNESGQLAAASYDWAVDHSDVLVTAAACGYERRCRVEAVLNASRGHIQVGDAVSVLRDHGVRRMHPAIGLTGQDVCMHAGGGPIRGSQTTMSWVVSTAPTVSTGPVLYATEGSAPCLSLYRPLLFPRSHVTTHSCGSGGDDSGTKTASTLCSRTASSSAWLADVATVLGASPRLTREEEDAKTSGASRWWSAEAFHRRALTQYNEWRVLTAQLQRTTEVAMLGAMHAASSLTEVLTPEERLHLVRTQWCAIDASVLQLRSTAAPEWVPLAVQDATPLVPAAEAITGESGDTNPVPPGLWLRLLLAAIGVIPSAPWYHSSWT